MMFGGMKEVYRVKFLVWRRDLTEYLHIIDAARDDPEIFTNRGSNPQQGHFEVG